MIIVLISTVIVTITTIFVCVIAYFKWTFGYWKRKKVPYAEPTIPFGTIGNPFKKAAFIGHRIKQRYDWFKSRGHKHGGLFMFISPHYFVIDTEYIKNILIKDFRYFGDRGLYYNERDDPVSANLLNLKSYKWKTVRSKLSPTFSSGKMKFMYPNLLVCGKQLKSAMEDYAENKQPVNIKYVLSCFTTDVIGSCAFGLECNSFKDPNSELIRQCNIVSSKVIQYQGLGSVIAMLSERLAILMRIVLVPKEVSRFFLDVVRKAVEYRETEQTKVTRKDFLQILIDLNKSDEAGFTIENITAHSFTFFLAGFETSSSVMSFCLYEMCANPEIQRKAREEVLAVYEANNGELDYDSISELKYLSQVVDETLRRYPPISVTPRLCVEDYQIPGTDVIIDKGTRVLIPIYGLHHDPEYFPEPEKFIPERFSEENKKNIVPFSFLPFGEGPRNCIGLRFGLMQTKVGLSILLKDFEFTINSKMKVPIELDTWNLLATARDGIWLDVKKLGT